MLKAILLTAALVLPAALMAAANPTPQLPVALQPLASESDICDLSPGTQVCARGQSGYLVCDQGRHKFFPCGLGTRCTKHNLSERYVLCN